MHLARGAVLLCGALLGCDAVLGIEALPHPVADSGFDATIEVGTDAATEADVTPDPCTQCTEKSCAAAVDACIADPTCGAGLKQVETCAVAQPRCRSDYERDHASTNDEAYLAADSCRRLACADQCFGGGFAVSLDKTCACADDACKVETRACVRSGESRTGEQIGACDRTLECIARSPDPDGYVICRSGQPGGAELDALRTCLRDNACDGCGLAHGELGCLGAYSYAAPSRTDINFGMKVVTAAGVPVAGAGVLTCSISSFDICDVLASGKTDATGTVVLDTATVDEMFVNIAPSGSYTTRFFPTRGIHIDEQLVVARTFDRDTIQAYATALGVTFDTSKESLFGTVHDCIWDPIDGAGLGSYDGTGALVPNVLDDPMATVGFFDGDTLKRGTATTKTGTFFVMNLTEGPHTIVIHRGSTVLATFRHVARANVVGMVDVFPQPKGR